MRHFTPRVGLAAACAAALVAAGPVSTAAAGPESPRTPQLSSKAQGRNVPRTAATKHDTSLQSALRTLVDAGAVGVAARASAPGVQVRASAGVRSMGAKAPAQPTDAFRIGSVSKTMLATLVMQRIERQQWRLNQTVGSIVPGLLPGHENVTVEQLLRHQSGIPDGVTGSIQARMDADTNAAFFTAISGRYTDAGIVQNALQQTWHFAPGSSSEYSNTGYIVLGMMLQAATRTSVPKLLQQNVFRPARMHQTWFATSPGLPGAALTGQSIVSATESYSEKPFNPTIFSSAGAVVSTTSDLNTFTRALFSGRLIKKSTLNLMLSSAPASNRLPGYGLGIYSVGDPCTPAGKPTQLLWGHDGATFGTFTLAFTSPDGKRQASLGYTGRYYTDPNQQQPYDANAALISALALTCPRK